MSLSEKPVKFVAKIMSKTYVCPNVIRLKCHIDDQNFFKGIHAG